MCLRVSFAILQKFENADRGIVGKSINRRIAVSQGAFDIHGNANDVVLSRPAADVQMLDARGRVVADRAMSLGLNDLRVRLRSGEGDIR